MLPSSFWRQPAVNSQFSPLMSLTTTLPRHERRVGMTSPTPFPDLDGAKQAGTFLRRRGEDAGLEKLPRYRPVLETGLDAFVATGAQRLFDARQLVRRHDCFGGADEVACLAADPL